MQVFKLVEAGFVDKVVGFEMLPERLIKGIRTREVSGFPRAWARWLSSVGSVRDVFRTETSRKPDSTYQYSYTVIGKEPCFFVLEYKDINSDKEAWKHISDYIKQVVGQEVRLKERIEDMARALAPDGKAPLELEPEDVPVIPLPKEKTEEKADQEIIKHGETILVEEFVPKKRGRPKKEPVEA